jgi:large subunit ribosomal protein L17e
MTNPCHIELILTEANEEVAKAQSLKPKVGLTSRQRGAEIRRAIQA